MTISDKNTRMPLTISKILKADLEKIAEKENRSLNNLIVTILKTHVDKIKREVKKETNREERAE